MHRRAAEILAAAGAPAERVAGHLLQVAPAADPAIVASLRAGRTACDRQRRHRGCGRVPAPGARRAAGRRGAVRGAPRAGARRAASRAALGGGTAFGGSGRGPRPGTGCAGVARVRPDALPCEPPCRRDRGATARGGAPRGRRSRPRRTDRRRADRIVALADRLPFDRRGAALVDLGGSSRRGRRDRTAASASSQWTRRPGRVAGRELPTSPAARSRCPRSPMKARSAIYLAAQRAPPGAARASRPTAPMLLRSSVPGGPATSSPSPARSDSSATSRLHHGELLDAECRPA